MKNKLLLLFLITTYNAITVSAQNHIPEKKVNDPGNVAPKIFRLLSVTLTVDSTTHPNSTATDAYIKETFAYLGSGMATYAYSETNQSAAGTSNISTTGTVTLNGTGTTDVFIKRGVFIRSVHTLKLITNTPNQVTSNTISY